MNLIVYFNGDFINQNIYLFLSSYMDNDKHANLHIFTFYNWLLNHLRVFKRLINIKEKIQIIILICGDLKMKILIFLICQFFINNFYLYFIKPSIIKWMATFLFLNFFIVYYVCYCVNNFS